ncbi:MAG: hypothetical protein ACRD0W_06550 [Acidimicrobiales bacterium]
MSRSPSNRVNTVGSDVDAENAVKPVVIDLPLYCTMFADSVVFPVPGVEFVAFVERTTSQNTGTADAVTPSNPIRNFRRHAPNWAGVITIRAVFAVAATRATAADVSTL